MEHPYKHLDAASNPARWLNSVLVHTCRQAYHRVHFVLNDDRREFWVRFERDGEVTKAISFSAIAWPRILQLLKVQSRQVDVRRLRTESGEIIVEGSHGDKYRLYLMSNPAPRTDLSATLVNCVLPADLRSRRAHPSLLDSLVLGSRRDAVIDHGLARILAEFEFFQQGFEARLLPQEFSRLQHYASKELSGQLYEQRMFRERARWVAAAVDSDEFALRLAESFDLLLGNRRRRYDTILGSLSEPSRESVEQLLADSVQLRSRISQTGVVSLDMQLQSMGGSCREESEVFYLLNNEPHVEVTASRLVSDNQVIDLSVAQPTGTYRRPTMADIDRVSAAKD